MEMKCAYPICTENRCTVQKRNLPCALAGLLESHTSERVEFDRVCTRLCRLPDADGERV